jgi:hypothetical protein
MPCNWAAKREVISCMVLSTKQAADRGGVDSLFINGCLGKTENPTSVYGFAFSKALKKGCIGTQAACAQQGVGDAARGYHWVLWSPLGSVP